MEIHEEIKPEKKKSRIVRLGHFLAAHPDLILQCVFAVVIFILGTYRLSEIYMPILYNDEYGYWAAAAFFMGDDWSSVTSKIPYYSYGYGLLLVPVRFFCRLFDLIWWEMYQCAALLNLAMLVGSYFIACRISKRYMEKMHWIVRSMACFAVVIYSSNMVYSHITLTENALYFFFWVFLYIMMRCVDRPSVYNHIALAVSVFYLYTIHQRAVAELIAAVMLILYMRLVGENTLKQAGAFLGSFYVCGLIHAMIKGKLQNDFYLGGPPAGVRDTLSYALTVKSLFLLAALAVLMVILYLIEKQKKKQLLVLVGICLIAGVLCAALAGGGLVEQGGEHRLTVNDFAGQWEKIQGIFSYKGFLRLLISITGKWFYLAAATGLVICWGMKESVLHIFRMAWDSLKRVLSWIRGKAYTPVRVMNEQRKADIWMLGVSLSWMGSIMVCAIYKEGLYKVDDLLNGRYNEFVMGILILYGFYSLVQDKHWIRTALACLVLYLLAGALCQYTFDELQRTDFELAHSVMLGRVFWNWEVPAGKIRALSRYVLPLGLSFIVAVKLFSSHLGGSKVLAARCLLGLLIPICAWTYLARSITDHYTVSINEKHMSYAFTLSFGISGLDEGDYFDIYFTKDMENSRWAEEIQFILPWQKIILIDSPDIPYDEEAFFITSRAHGSNPEVLEKCIAVLETNRFSVLVGRESGLMERYYRRHPELTQEL